jgi:hypothetical protein
MAVRKPEDATVLNNWSQRAAYYSSLGLTPASYYKLAQQDVANVQTYGAAPMSTAEVNAAMAAQLAGRSLIDNPQPQHHRGIFGDIAHALTPSTWSSDVGGLIFGFPAGAINFVHHFPSEAHGLWDLLYNAPNADWMQSHGYEPVDQGSILHQIAVSFRDLAKQPIFSLVPGVADVANLTTPAGREHISSHPISSVLDVVTVGKVAELGTRGALAATGRTAEEGTALQSLSKGKVLQASARGVQKGIQAGFPASRAAQALTRSPLTGDRYIDEMVNRWGYGDQAKALQYGKSVGERAASNHVKHLTYSLRKMMAPLSDDRRLAITNEATLISPRTVDNQPFVLKALELQDTLQKIREEQYKTSKGKFGQIMVPYGKGFVDLQAGDKAIGIYRHLDHLTGRLIPRAQQQLSNIKDQLDKHQQEAQDIRRQALQERLQTGQFSPQTIHKLQDVTAKLDGAVKAFNRVSAHLTSLLGDKDKTVKRWNEELHAGIGTARMSAKVKATWRARLAATSEDAFTRAINDPTHPLYDPTPIDAQLKQGYAGLQEALMIINESQDIARIKTAFVDYADSLSPGAADKAVQQFDDLRKGAVDFVLGLIRRGENPVWLHHVPPGHEPTYLAHRVAIIPDHIADTRMFVRGVLDFSPGTMDIALGLTRAARQTLQQQATRAFLETFVLPVAKSAGWLHDQYLKIARDDSITNPRLATHGVAERAQVLIDRSWEKIDPQHYGLQDWPAKFRNTDMYVPKWMAKNLRALMPEERRGPSFLQPGGKYDTVMRVFRFSVLTGPRHVVHVAIGGLMPLMMEEPSAPLYFGRSLRVVLDYMHGKPTPYEELLKHIHPDITDATYDVAVGKTYANVLLKFWRATGQRFERKMAQIEEITSDMYRVSAAMSAEGRGLSHEEAFAIGNKVAVNMDDMAPIERTVLKHVFPFYGFQKFLFRFAFNYPVDHPYRATLISRFAAQEQEEWNNQLPQKFMMTLFLGHPDSHGNIKAIDMRNLNPFRSFSNDLTMVGFMQSLNPIISAPFVARGFNILDGVGPLYPSMEFNNATGTLQASPPGGAPLRVAEQFVPEIGVLDHFVQLTDNMRRLKATNSAAYQATLYSQLNLPGILAPPVEVNLPYVQERAEIDRYKVAESAVTKYTEGKASADVLRSFSYVPYQGQYYTPDQFIDYWNNLKRAYPGINPRAAISTPIRKVSQSPLELLGMQGGAIPPPEQRTTF